jgi:hypothetical protein
MEKGYSFNKTEKLKRNWLVQIMLKRPQHQLSYFGMLTDDSLENRKGTLQHFIIDMESRGVNVLPYNSINGYTKNDRYSYTNDFLKLYKENGSNDEIIFADPNTGFYSTDVSTVKESKHIDMEMIKMLIDGISDNSTVFCFQYNQNDTYTRGIEKGIEAYIVDNNLDIKFTLYDDFISAVPQLKFYEFKKMTSK